MPSRKVGVVVLLCGLALVAAGCKKRTVHAAPPVVSPPATGETPPPTTPPPGTKPEPTSPTPPPPAPKPVAPPPKPTPRKPEPPQLSPRLSPEEQAEYERKTNEAIAAAEKNLQVAYGKQLNTTQHDLMEKIRGFLAQAHEAIRASDWVRAQNLAQKAYVLSVELVNSL